MRLAPLLALMIACGSPPRPKHPDAPAPAVPRDDIARAKPDSPIPGDGSHLAVKDPRVTDLDIVRIRATPRGVGGEPEMSAVSSAEMFKKANEQFKSGNTMAASTMFRELVHEFPDSMYAPVSMFNIAAILDGQGDYKGTVAALRELIKTYPDAHESIEGHMYIAALQAEHKEYATASATLAELLARQNLTFEDRLEAFARRGYVELEQAHLDDADKLLEQAIAAWRAAPRVEDPYYIAMAYYYRGEIVHRRYTDAPVRLPDEQLATDLENKRLIAGKAYDLWKESLHFQNAYWGTASGYQMSQIFVELWEAHVKAPFPKRIDAATRPKYIAEVHDRVREHLDKALEGHRMNVELAKAYGVDTVWSQASAKKAAEVMELLAKESAGQYVTPES